MKNRVLFYSSVNSIDLFRIQRFYLMDINILNNIGFNVCESNRITDFLYFWKYDIAFIYFYRYGLFPAIISRIYNKKIYFTGGIDNLDITATKYNIYIVQKILFKLCRNISNCCILVSSSDVQNIKKIYGDYLPAKTYLSYHAIEVDKYYNVAVNDKDEIFSTISWMGNIENVYRKGIDKALRIFKDLSKRNEYSECELIIIGKEGIGSEYLKRLCYEYNISKKVHFTGNISEDKKISILKKSKYYFQLSSYEGFGIAALEALAARNIVIHSGRGGLKEVVRTYGIEINIDSDITNQVEYLYAQLINYNYEKMDNITEYIIREYSMEKRKNDIKYVLEKY